MADGYHILRITVLELTYKPHETDMLTDKGFKKILTALRKGKTPEVKATYGGIEAHRKGIKVVAAVEWAKVWLIDGTETHRDFIILA